MVSCLSVYKSRAQWSFTKTSPIKLNHLDQTVIFAVIQVFPCTLFPVLIRYHTRSPRDSTCSTLSALPLLAGRALDSRFSFGAILSIDTRSSREFPEVRGVQSFPGYPGHLWLLHGHHDHHDLVPQETQAFRAYQGYHHNRKEVAGLEWERGYELFRIHNNKFSRCFYHSLVYRVFVFWISYSVAILREQYFTISINITLAMFMRLKRIKI